MEKIEHALEWLKGVAPKIWQTFDTLTNEECRALSHYPITEVGKLFKPTGSGPASYNISGLECPQCHRAFTVTGISRTKLLEAINGMKPDSSRRKKPRSRWVPLCSDCVIKNGRKSREEQEAESERRWKIRRKNTDKFIELFLSPTSKWGIDAYKWYRSVMDNICNCEEEDVSQAIREMNYKDFLQTPYWKAIAQQVRYKADYRCQICNADAELHIHHRTYEIHGSEHRNLSELICACSQCHQTHHFSSPQ